MWILSTLEKMWFPSVFMRWRLSKIVRRPFSPDVPQKCCIPEKNTFVIFTFSLSDPFFLMYIYAKMIEEPRTFSFFFHPPEQNNFRGSKWLSEGVILDPPTVANKLPAAVTTWPPVATVSKSGCRATGANPGCWSGCQTLESKIQPCGAWL